MTTEHNEQQWPEYLMLRDTGLHDNAGGLGQRIFTTAGAGYEKQKYVRAELGAQPAAAQEAVAVVSAETFNNDGTSDIIKPALPIGTKLYAAPVTAAPEVDLRQFRPFVERERGFIANRIDRCDAIGTSERLTVLQAELANADRLLRLIDDSRLIDASPKGGSEARDAARYRWLRDEAISFPYDVEIASPWCVFGMNTAGAEINPIDGTKLDAAIDAARRFAEDNQPQASDAEVRP